MKIHKRHTNKTIGRSKKRYKLPYVSLSCRFANIAYTLKVLRFYSALTRFCWARSIDVTFRENGRQMSNLWSLVSFCWCHLIPIWRHPVTYLTSSRYVFDVISSRIWRHIITFLCRALFTAFVWVWLESLWTEQWVVLRLDRSCPSFQVQQGEMLSLRKHFGSESLWNEHESYTHIDKLYLVQKWSQKFIEFTGSDVINSGNIQLHIDTFSYHKVL